MRRFRPACLLPAVLATALVLTPRDIPFHEGSVAFIGDSVTLGGNASAPEKDFVSLVTGYIDSLSGDQNRSVFLSFDPATDRNAAAQAMQHDRRFVIVELGVHAVIDQSISADEFRQMYGSILDCVTGGDEIVVAGTIPWLGLGGSRPRLRAR